MTFSFEVVPIQKPKLVYTSPLAVTLKMFKLIKFYRDGLRANKIYRANNLKVYKDLYRRKYCIFADKWNSTTFSTTLPIYEVHFFFFFKKSSVTKIDSFFTYLNFIALNIIN